MIGKRTFLRLLHFIRREIDTTLNVDGIIFDVSHHIPYLRAVTLLTKEPETIAWIDDRVSPGEVVYDIGANVGVYSLYAAKFRGAQVVSFEPLAENYAILNRNIFLNNLSKNITAFNLAVHDETMISSLNVSELWAGKAGNSFNQPSGSSGEQFDPKFLQGMLGVSLDDFIDRYQLPFPNHFKIDVDGNEDKVIAGMKRILSDMRVKTIAVELSEHYKAHVDVVRYILSHGYTESTNPRYIRQDGDPGSQVVNKIFVRSNGK